MTRCENIMLQTFAGVKQFFGSPNAPWDGKLLVHKLESVSWPELYQRIEAFLRSTQLVDRNSAIVAFAKTLPEYPSFASNLEHSLALHESFWNQVYANLKLAQQSLW